MIVVSGVPRSGTSLWMRILRAAGFEIIGEAFPEAFVPTLSAANPQGFFETSLRDGIWWATHPDPRSGAWLSPATSRDLVVKVFAPGVVRSDIAYLDAVILTVRPWREQTAAMARLYALEDAHDDGQRDERARSRSKRAPTDDWFLDHYDLLRDASIRGYRVIPVDLARLRAEPHDEVAAVLGALGQGDLEAAVAEARIGAPASVSVTVGDGDEARANDALWAALFSKEPLSDAAAAALDERASLLRAS
jgi:hypothetical protein